MSETVYRDLPPWGHGPESSVYTVAPDPFTWPEVEMVNEETTDYMGKKAVASLVKEVESLGWSVRVTKAKGSYPSVGQKPSRARWSLAVRMSRGDDRAVAVYVEPPSEDGGTWSWDTLYRWTVGQFPDKYASITPFRAALT